MDIRKFIMAIKYCNAIAYLVLPLSNIWLWLFGIFNIAFGNVEIIISYQKYTGFPCDC